jgi:hypothetical protein
MRDWLKKNWKNAKWINIFDKYPGYRGSPRIVGSSEITWKVNILKKKEIRIQIFYLSNTFESIFFRIIDQS